MQDPISSAPFDLDRASARPRPLASGAASSDPSVLSPPGGRLLDQHPWILMLVTVSDLWLLYLAGFPRGRFLVIAGIIAMNILLSVDFSRRLHSRPVTVAAESLWASMALRDLFLPAAVIVTGGIHSPIAPVLLVLPLVTVSFLRWTRPARIIVVGFVAIVGLLLILPNWITGPPIASPYFEIILACNLVIGMVVGCHTVLALSHGVSAANRMLHSAREHAIDVAGRRAKSVEQVGAKVAHELKNPLAAIKSLLQLEVAAARDPRSEQRFVVMTREVGRMEAILRDYLSFARPLEDICVRPMDLGTVADNVAALLEGRAAAAGIHLERQRGPGPVPVPGDSRRLEEAVLNLAANALEATPRGGHVVIETVLSAGQGVLKVRDSGIGMDLSVLDKIGTPFFTTRAEGTGLGVVLARAVIVQHGGRLEFSSRPRQGTIATVTLPGARLDGETAGLGGGEVNG